MGYNSETFQPSNQDLKSSHIQGDTQITMAHTFTFLILNQLRLKKSARLPLAREATKRDGLQFAMTVHKSLFFIILFLYDFFT